MRFARFFWLLCVSALGGSAAGVPNLVVILVDDLGYGDLGCYGSPLHETPHIDRLAAEGVRFTDFHSNGPMCTPTRAALLTGLYQNRLGRKFESALSGRAHYHEGLPHRTLTLAEALAERGYVSGCFGKWHLGYQPPNLPTDHGFDVFRGLVSGDGDHHTHVDRSGRADWWHDDRKVSETGYTAELLTKHAEEFIRQHQEQPFLVYLPHLAIHFPWQGPEDPPHRHVGQDYWNDKWGVIPNRDDVRPHVKAMVESVDRSVGRLIKVLHELKLDRKTVVFFLSDNGGYINYSDSHRQISSNGPLRGQKTEPFEGGHRVPAIAWWPGQIAPAVVNDPAMTFDLFPTLLRLTGALELPAGLDGVDLAPVLFQQESLSERVLYWRMGDEGAVRQGPWKWVQLAGADPMLFNLSTDVGEASNLATVWPRKLAELGTLYREWESSLVSTFGE